MSDFPELPDFNLGWRMTFGLPKHGRGSIAGLAHNAIVCISQDVDKDSPRWQIIDLTAMGLQGEIKTTDWNTIDPSEALIETDIGRYRLTDIFGDPQLERIDNA